MSSFIPTVQLYQEPTDIKTDWEQSLYTNYVGLACFTALLWDHAITLADEIEFVWFGGKGLFTILFFAVRYLTPCLFAINLYAYFSPVWTTEMCNRFIPFEGVATTFDVVAVNLMMLIRVRALYLKQKLVTGVLAAMILAELVLQVVLIATKAQAVKHTSAVHSCTMIFEPSASAAAAATAWIPLLYDTVVFGLTAHKVLHTSKSTARSGAILKQLFTGGLLYYSVMLIVTLVLTLMIPLAPPGLKNITAQSEQLMTVAMMSRITIQLKKASRMRTTLRRSDVYRLEVIPRQT